MNEITALLRDKRHELCICQMRIWGGSRCKPGKEPPPDIKAASAPTLDFLASRTVRNKFLLLTNLTQCLVFCYCSPNGLMTIDMASFTYPCMHVPFQHNFATLPIKSFSLQLEYELALWLALCQQNVVWLFWPGVSISLACFILVFKNPCWGTMWKS